MAFTDEQIKSTIYQSVFKKLCPYCLQSIVDNHMLHIRGQLTDPNVNQATYHRNDCQGVATYGL